MNYHNTCNFFYLCNYGCSYYVPAIKKTVLEMMKGKVSSSVFQ